MNTMGWKENLFIVGILLSIIIVYGILVHGCSKRQEAELLQERKQANELLIYAWGVGYETANEVKGSKKKNIDAFRKKVESYKGTDMKDFLLNEYMVLWE
jgi:hypothetical protein